VCLERGGPSSEASRVIRVRRVIRVIRVIRVGECEIDLFLGDSIAPIEIERAVDKRHVGEVGPPFCACSPSEEVYVRCVCVCVCGGGWRWWGGVGECVCVCGGGGVP
jgi:hypothetical protein